MKTIIICMLVSVCMAEIQAPYPASGWQPQGPQLKLPTEYGPPQPQESGNYEVEITQENVEYVGQLGETTTNVNNEYLPPTTEATSTEDDADDILRVQGLPKEAKNIYFNTGEVAPAEVSENAAYRQQQRLQQQRLQKQRVQQQLRVQQQQRGQPQRVQQQPQFGNFRQVHPLFPQPQQFGNLAQQPAPKDAYGPPPQEEVPQTTAQPEPEEEETPSTDAAPESDYDDAEDDEPNVAISTAIASNGQYYVLGPNNVLQRVVYMTSQTEDDIRNMGYSAQLRYSKVDPIRDPVYAYDAQGQLLRIYN